MCVFCVRDVLWLREERMGWKEIKERLLLTGAREPGSRSSRLFKKLHEARHHRDKNSEGRTTAQKSGGTKCGTTGDQGQGNELSGTNEVSTPLTTPCPILRGNKVSILQVLTEK